MAADAAEAGPQRSRREGRGTVRGMVPSMAVVLLAAFAIYLFVPHDEDVDPVKPISYRVELDSARRAAPYPVLAPEGLPGKWRATSVSYEADGSGSGGAWHLGFMTPDTQYAAVEQSDEARPARFIERVTQGAQRTAGTTRAGGHEWTRYEGRKYDALVREVAGGQAGKGGKDSRGGTGGKSEDRHTGPYAVVVTGTASFSQLGEMAAALSSGDGARKR